MALANAKQLIAENAVDSPYMTTTIANKVQLIRVLSLRLLKYVYHEYPNVSSLVEHARVEEHRQAEHRGVEACMRGKPRDERRQIEHRPAIYRFTENYGYTYCLDEVRRGARHWRWR